MLEINEQLVDINSLISIQIRERTTSIGIITGPNGAGKTSTLRMFNNLYPNILIVKRHTTKQTRPNDIVYERINHQETNRLLEHDQFIECAQYGPGYYGTLIEELIEKAQKSQTLITEMDVIAARVFKRRLQHNPQLRIILFYLYPSASIGNLDDAANKVQERFRNRDRNENEQSRLNKAIVTLSQGLPEDAITISSVLYNPTEIAKMIYQELKVI